MKYKQAKLLIFCSIVYVGTFRVLSYLIGKYHTYIDLPIIYVFAIEQTLVPFIFGFVLVFFLKPLSCKEVLLVVFMPVAIGIAVLIADLIENSQLTVTNESLFYVALILQIISVLGGGYTKFHFFRLQPGKPESEHNHSKY